MTNVSVVSKNPLVIKIAEGTAGEDLMDMLFQKQLPFTEEEYLEAFVFAHRDEVEKAKAVNLLKDISENTKASYLDKQEANHRVAYFLILEALDRQNTMIISKAVRNQALPYEFLLEIAEKGNGQILEILLDNQIKLIAYPEILEQIEKNPEATNFILGRVNEIRAYYLESHEVEEIPQEAVMDVLEDLKEVIILETEKEREAVEEGRQDDEDDEGEDDLLSLEAVEEKALTTLQEINAMTISERIKLALTGSKTQRMILVKDANKMVSAAVLESPKLGVDEISLLARNKSIAGEIIAKIANRRDWVKNYSVMYELIHNPKTPIKDALSFVKKLHMRDLQLIARDKNVNPVVRQLAMNFQKQKSGVKG